MQTPAASGSNRAAWLLILAGLVVGLLAGLLVFVGFPLAPGGAAVAGTPGTPAPAPVAGAPAPDFSLTDLSGQTVTLSALKGEVVLINFWATWCGPCRHEMPAIQAQYDALKEQGFTVLAVNVDEPAGEVQEFVDLLELNFTVLLDPSAQVNDLYRVRGYPTTFLVNRDGLIERQHVGPLTEGQLSDYLTKLGLVE